MFELEKIYDNLEIQIYRRETLFTVSYNLVSENKVLATYYGQRMQRMFIVVESIPFSYLEKFHEVVTDDVLKAL